MFIKIILLTFVLLLETTRVMSAVSVSMTQKDLEKLLKNYRTDYAISGDFIQEKYIKELDLNLKSNGRFNVVNIKDDAIVIDWLIDKPEKMHICINGKNIYIKDSVSSKTIEQSLSKIENNDPTGMAKLRTLIQMNSDVLSEKYNVSLEKNKLIFKEKNTTSHSFIEMNLDSKNYVSTFSVFEESGDKLSIQFKNIKIKSKNHIKKTDCTKNM